jgi:hypothetical protein
VILECATIDGKFMEGNRSENNLLQSYAPSILDRGENSLLQSYTPSIFQLLSFVDFFLLRLTICLIKNLKIIIDFIIVCFITKEN